MLYVLRLGKYLKDEREVACLIGSSSSFHALIEAGKNDLKKD